MNRLKLIKERVNEVIETYCAPEVRHKAYVHLYGVSSVCAMLALKRGLEPVICATMGLLHDIYTYRVNNELFHAQSGAEMARVILKRTKCFTEDEQVVIRTAISRHSDKEHTHDAYSEALKDADTLQPFLEKGAGVLSVTPPRMKRLRALAGEYGFDLPDDVGAEEEADEQPVSINRDEDIAKNAEALAASGIVGARDDIVYMDLIHYWPEKEAFDELKNAWCAAFIYHVCMLSGLALPIKHPRTSTRFAGVGAWYEWGAHYGFYHEDKDGFTPRRGDVVIYNGVIPADKKPKDAAWHDHIGVVIGVDDKKLIVAEGNVGNDNVSGIVERVRGDRIGGYVRVPDVYSYNQSAD